MNTKTFNQTNSKNKITIIIGFATDFILMLGGIVFNFTFLILPPPGIVILAIIITISLLRRKTQPPKIFM